jgi:hypothetical protein
MKIDKSQAELLKSCRSMPVDDKDLGPDGVHRIPTEPNGPDEIRDEFKSSRRSRSSSKSSSPDEIKDDFDRYGSGCGDGADRVDEGYLM